MKALQFSGGKDSLALLYFMRAQWDELTVMWVNTGAAFPETLEQMERIKHLVPHFLEVKSSQTIDTEGYPADLLPTGATRLGRLSNGTTGQLFQSRFDCCGSALWAPTHQAMKDHGFTVGYRGQRASDALKSPVASGTAYEGVSYEFPIYDWSDEQVMDYLRENKVLLPANYGLMSTGLDCWNCSAYLSENAGKMEYMRRNHPEKHAHMVRVFSDLRAEINLELSHAR